MLIQSDARAIPLGNKSVQCVITSPPYWGLRDYGLGDEGIGLESTPDEWVASIVDVFREVWRVLRDDGTIWVNLGDCYNSNQGSGFDSNANGIIKVDHLNRNTKRAKSPVPPKNLLGLPWRVAFALQADGWYLRQEIIWHKPNPMPESCKDRPTRAHEQLFLLSKSPRYFYDAEAVFEKSVTPEDKLKLLLSGTGRPRYTDDQGSTSGSTPSGGVASIKPRYRNKRSVWTIPTQPIKESHFATFPEKLVEPCILAGSAVGDVALDPFVGSGTVVRVAIRHNRLGVGCDRAYHHISAMRTSRVQRKLKDA
tara:strand:+ start:454 stop:1380 length:927 start_codon:yes stop_codon:yes gene_type:complete